VWSPTLSHKKAQKHKKISEAFCASLRHHFFEARKSLTLSAMLPYTKQLAVKTMMSINWMHEKSLTKELLFAGTFSVCVLDARRGQPTLINRRYRH